MENTVATFPERRPRESLLSSASDEALIARARAGDQLSFEEFVRRHMTAVHRWMVRSVGETDADDLTQDVFLRAYRGLSRYREEAPPRVWLAAIANNAIKNRYRSRSRFRRIFSSHPEPDSLAERESDSASPEESVRAGEARDSIVGALSKLPLEFRLPVVLRDLEEWSYEEIAISLELPIGTVKSRIARGRGQLRAILAPLLEPEKNP